MNELNGFKIDKYNQYDIPENKKHYTCPICSADRKKKKDPCATYYWDTGMGKCHHCGIVIQLHTYKKKEVKKEYKRPEWKNNTKLSDKLVTWFENRSISQFTLRQMKIAEGPEWMPQTKKEENIDRAILTIELTNLALKKGVDMKQVTDSFTKRGYTLENAPKEIFDGVSGGLNGMPDKAV